MKYNLTLSAIVFLLSILVISCNKGNKETSFSTNEIVKTDFGEYRVFNNEKHGYKINIPLKWAYTFKKNTILIAQNPKGNKTDFRETMDVVKVDGGFTFDGNNEVNNKVDLNKFFEDHLYDLSITDFQTEVEGRGEKIINGVDAKWAVLKDKRERHDIRVIKYFYSDDENIYIVTGSMMENDFAVQGPIFNEIAESFVIL